MASGSSLQDRVALVTGAGSGIGRAIAVRLARDGARVALVGRRADELNAVQQEIASAGGVARAWPADVTDRPAVDDAVRSVVGAWGAVTLLVNNAGAGRSAAFLKMSADLWHDMLAVNLTGAFHLCQAALPHMLAAGGGRIVNVASVAGLKGCPYVSAYVAAKHGLVGLTRALAVELAAKNVTVNAVCPGFVDTPMTQATLNNIVQTTGRTPQAARAELEAMSPQRRLFDPREVAALVAFLCSPDARGINGQAIPVCGGEMAV